MLAETSGNLFDELKRRDVFRTGAAYLVVAWLLVQVADILLDAFGAPDWTMQVLVVGLAIGFPIALILGWVYEISSKGVRRTSVTETSPGVTDHRKIDFAIIGILLVAVMMFAAERFRLIEFGGSPGVDRRSIAVLPFTNRSALDEDLYFVDGIHDDLLTSLAKVHDLFVISRTSVMRYRDSEMPIREIAEQLGVAVVLEGGVQRAGDSVRINVQLIDGSTDEHIWAETYDRALSAENIFAIQSEISETIASSLSAALTVEERQRIERRPTDSLEALDALLLGDQRRTLATMEGRRQAENYYRRAIELDGQYSDAWQRLAAVLLSRWRNKSLRDEAMLEAKSAVEKAIEIDEQNGDAWSTRGEIEMEFSMAGFANFGNDEIEQMFVRAMDLMPNSGHVLARYAVWVSWHDYDHPRIISLLERAVSLDPLEPGLHNRAGDEYRKQLRFADAQRTFARARELRPDDPIAYWHSGEAYRDAGDLADAIIWMEKAVEFEPDDPDGPFTLALVAADLGEFELARTWLFRGREIGPTHNMAIYTRPMEFYLDNDLEGLRQVAEEELATGAPYLVALPAYRTILRDRDIDAGSPELALERYKQYTPSLFLEDPDLDKVHPNDASNLAYLLQLVGQEERAERILRSLISWLEGQGIPGVVDSRKMLRFAEARGLLGQLDEARELLDRVAVNDWPMSWMVVSQNRTLDVVRDTDEFKALDARIQKRLSEQRVRLAELRRGSLSLQ